MGIGVAAPGRERALTQRSAAAAALRLASGVAIPHDHDWSDVLRTAIALRLAPLAWVRSAAFIRAHAPDGISAAWRQQYGIAAARATQRLDIAFDLVQRLGERGVDAGVGKGFVTAVTLYGDAGARWSSDVDLYVALEQRTAALAVMIDGGWMRVDGEAPYDETFLRQVDGEAAHVEIHSGLVHPRLTHLPRAEPAFDHLDIDGRRLRTVHEAELPLMLAMHLAKHQFPPLLWDLDFHTAWMRLDVGGKTSALDRVRAMGLERYVAWGAHRSGLVAAVLDGNDSALDALGYRGAMHRGSHPMWRHVRLAPTWRARAICCRGWMLPPWVDTSGGVGRALLLRSAGMWRQLLPTFRSTADGRATARSP